MMKQIEMRPFPSFRSGLRVTLGVLLLLVSLAGHGFADDRAGFLPSFSLANGTGSTDLYWNTDEGTMPSGPGNGPESFLCDENRSIYLADSLNGRILVLSPAGELERTLDLTTVKAEANLEEVPMVVDMALLAPETLCLADSANNVVLFLTVQGGLVRVVGPDLPDGRRFRQINRVHLDGAGNLFVEDLSRFRTFVFSGQGEYLADLEALTNIAVDRSGRIFQPVFSGNRREREVEIHDLQGRKTGVLGKIVHDQDIVYIAPLGFDGSGNLFLTFQAGKLRWYVAMDPGGAIVSRYQVPVPEFGLSATRPEWVSPLGEVFCIRATPRTFDICKLTPEK